MLDIPREQWTTALNQLPNKVLEEWMNNLPKAWSIRPKSLPQAGLALLKLRESTQSMEFYLGEFPLASMYIAVTLPDGLEYDGAALVMDDDLNRAEAMALCDCVLANRLPGWQDVAQLIGLGHQQFQQKQQQRKLILQRTRVNFSLLEDVGDEDA